MLALAALCLAAASARGGNNLEKGESLAPFDIRPFSLPNTTPDEVWFEEARDIVRLVVEFDRAIPDDVVVFYQRKVWPETRLEESSKSHPGGFGWTHQDDWFNGQWQRAAVEVVKLDERRAEIRFQGIKTEMPKADLGDYDVVFRRTYAVKVEAKGNPAIESVYTTSAPAHTDLRVELDAGVTTPGGNGMGNDGYNAVVGAASEAARASEPRCFRIGVNHMVPSHAYSGDDGQVKFDFNGEPFTISLVSLEQEGLIWYEELGVFITRVGDPTTFKDYRERIRDLKTIRERVLEHPEQSLSGAHNGQPRPHVDNYNLGCTGAAQRFWLDFNGDITLHKRNVTWLPSMHPERWRNRGENAARFHFGLENWRITARYPDPEPVMAYTIKARREGLSVEQQSFAVPLLTPILSGDWQGGDPMVALLRFRFRNDGPAPVRAELPIQYSQDDARSGHGATHDGHRMSRGPLDTLTVRNGHILSAFKDKPYVRCALDTAMAIEAQGDTVLLSRELQPGELCDAVVKIPYVVPEGDKELAALDGLSFDSCQPLVAQYWNKAATGGARVQAPEPELGALHTSHLAHVLMADYKMPDGLVNTSVGTSTYGNFSNESCMIVNELDQRGIADEAQKRLDLWIKYQGTVEQPGNFTDHKGMYYGADGFEQGSYNQHHGWVLWCLCEHYLLTHDDAWFRKNADSIIAGADWIFRQRKNTMTELPHSRGWERGFLPAGSLEDVTDFYYWLSTNTLTWRAAEYTARALEAAGHSEAARVRGEADAYKADLIKGFETQRENSPIVRLRDGRWIPDYPSRLYRRGREVGWIREVLEGSVYLLLSGLYDPNSKQGQWILDDFQDNRYLNPPYGYSVPDFDMTWFSRGGMSMQPNLLAGLLPHLDRDEPEIYLWMFYNAWNSCYREEANAMVEHPLPVLGWSNAVLVKTSDEANAVTWLRYMYVYPKNGLLHFGRAIPRAWFAQTQPFSVTDLVTEFGKASVTYTADPKANTARAVVNFEQVHAPRQMLVRFRVPEGKTLRSATVNGAGGKISDAARGDVDISGMTGTITVEAVF
jgi:hypothetical protein